MARVSDRDTRAVYHGATEVRRVYHGATLVWPRTPKVPTITTVYVNTDRQLSATVTVRNRHADTITVDWGDGTRQVGVPLDPHGTATVTHTYGAANPYTITWTTVDARQADVFTLVTPHALVLTPSGVGGGAITLTASLKTQVPIDIDWGDGSPRTPVAWPNAQALSAQLTHTYAVPGVYTVTGRDGTATTSITVSTILPPYATIKLVGVDGRRGNLEIEWTASAGTATLLIDGVVSQTLRGLGGTARVKLPDDATTHTVTVQTIDHGLVGASTEVYGAWTHPSTSEWAIIAGIMRGSLLTGQIDSKGASDYYLSIPWPPTAVHDGGLPISFNFPLAGPQSLTIRGTPNAMGFAMPLVSLNVQATAQHPPANTPFAAVVDMLTSWPDIILSGTANTQTIQIDWSWGDTTNRDIGPRIETILVSPDGTWWRERDMGRRPNPNAPFTAVVTEIGGAGRSQTLQVHP